jgi:hypothetical protein
MIIKTRWRSRCLCAFLGLLIGELSAISTVANASEPQGGRYALIIGNSSYGGTDDVSGVKDAERMAELLSQIHFKVVKVPNGTLETMNKQLDDFGLSIKTASLVVFFYSGHGFQNGTENYLLPVNGSVDPSDAIPLAKVKDTLARAKDAVKLVFLDACREEKRLPKNAPQGLNAEQTPSSRGTLYSFAAGPGTTAPAGSADGYSPFSTALLKYLREPGLTIAEILDAVRAELVDSGQLPAYVVNDVPSDFYVRAPVNLRARIEGATDQLLVVVNGEIALNSNDKTEQRLHLRAGKNELSLVVAKNKSYHNNHDWDTTEGWSYSLKLGLRQEGEIYCSGPNQNGYCFSGKEDTPFKDGPHHGKAFEVAKATLIVDGSTEPPKVSLENADTEIWKHKTPIWAQNQEPLYDESVSSLNLKPEDILDGLALQPPWNVLLKPLVQQVLTSGTLLNHKVADPSQTFVTVWGNRVLRNSVQTCMTQHRDDRLSDLKKGIAAVFSRSSRPFEIFDRGLIDCVRDVEQRNLSPLQPSDILIWTAIEEGSHGGQGALTNRPTSNPASTYLRIAVQGAPRE